MSPRRQAVVDEVLDALKRQGFLLYDRDGNCYARPLHDTKNDYPTLVRDLRHSPVPTAPTKERE